MPCKVGAGSAQLGHQAEGAGLVQRPLRHERERLSQRQLAAGVVERERPDRRALELVAVGVAEALGFAMGPRLVAEYALDLSQRKRENCVAAALQR